MRNIRMVVTVLVISFIPLFSYAETKWDNLLRESAKVFDDMANMPDTGIPSSLLEDCYAVAIFPSTINGGFIIGGQYGQGVIVARDKKTDNWSAPAVFNIFGGSFGWQIGGQAADIILLIMSERGLDGIMQSKLKLGGDIAVSAGPIGRDTQASIDLQLKGGILSYSRSRGLFAGIKIEGAAIAFNDSANKSLYGKSSSARDILIKQTVKPTKSADRLLKELKNY
ncbi:Ysc84 actin-binding domain protein [Candidatus Omnitrophus magneticus]|uniref:Ysc84 actin-binding domain protein n=1 Tax=Candidatus Omnitrophus magneticus TaxID=1609969 RepID=A0A0F0CIY1_9BACT|nr:Ysc84 actin-binding domain protein [Candidatus Omnitrophus magneticus]